MRLSTLTFLALTVVPGFAKAQTIDIPQVLKLIQYYSSLMKSAEPWVAVPGNHIILEYVPSPIYRGALVTAIRDAFDDGVVADCKVLQLPLPEKKITVYLFPSPSDLGRAMHSPAPWKGGFSMADWSAIADEGKGLTPALRSTALHELAHAVMALRFGYFTWPIFSEGSAIFVQASVDKEPWVKHPRPSTSTTMTGYVINWRKLTQADHHEGAEFMAYLVSLDRGNPSRLTQLLKKIGQERTSDLRQPKLGSLKRIDAAFRAVYGQSMDELETQWRRQK